MVVTSHPTEENFDVAELRHDQHLSANAVWNRDLLAITGLVHEPVGARRSNPAFGRLSSKTGKRDDHW